MNLLFLFETKCLNLLVAIMNEQLEERGRERERERERERGWEGERGERERERVTNANKT